MTNATEAVYRQKGIEEFYGNPMIEALPDLPVEGELVSALERRPFYDESERSLDKDRRLDLVQRLKRVHQPIENDMRLAAIIRRCIQWGYATRNPLSREYVLKIIKEYDAGMKKALEYIDTYYPNTMGFAIVGMSGVGKSSTIEGILDLFPQVIRHTRYKNVPFQAGQVVWMKVDCTCDGSLKGLCISVFQEFDRLLGTDYVRTMGKRTTLDLMLVQIAQLASIHNLGILVIDEMQNLSNAKSGGAGKMLNFFTTLVNTIGIPVIMMGTPKVLPLFQSELQQAKRASGQGDFVWDCMREDDPNWDLLLDSVWQYQYTRTPIPLTNEMRKTFYAETQGIIFLASTLYTLAQEDAIYSGSETFNASDVRRIASERLRLTEPMRNVMRDNDDLMRLKYPDMSPIKPVVFEHYSVSAEKDAPPPARPDPPSLTESAAASLTGMGIKITEARILTARALSALGKDCRPEDLARHAFILHLSEEKNNDDGATPDEGAFSGTADYESLKKAGLIASEEF